MLEAEGGRSWQPLGEGKNGRKVFVRRVVAIFAKKSAVFALNYKFENLIKYNMQHVPCTSDLLAQ